MNSQVARERRQLELASAVLDAYRGRSLKLGRLVADLDALLNEFRLQEDQWREEFREYWWTLEQFYAVALDRLLDPLPDDYQVVVDEAVDQLRFLIDAALDRCRDS